MATTITHTVRASGGDYADLSTWEAAQQRDLVTADEIAKAECYNDWPSGLDDQPIIDGWTTDATRYVEVTVASGHRHDGAFGSGFYISTDKSYGFAFQMAVGGYVRYVEVHNKTTLPSGAAFYVTSGSATVVNCLGRTDSPSGNNQAFRNTVGDLISCKGKSASGIAFHYNNYTANVEWSNCVAVDSATGFSMNTAGAQYPTLTNCVAYNCTTDYTGTENASSATCATSAASTAYSFVTVTGVASSDFVDPSTDNYHLASGSSLIGVGTNLYSTFTTDIDGDTWPSSGAWDIGFDYYVSAAPARIKKRRGFMKNLGKGMSQ